MAFKNIATFVFFDIETTGLPQLEKNRTTITELCLIAVMRQDLERASSKEIPVSSNLVFNYNPRKEISEGASKMTGLTNEILKYSPVFGQRTKTLLAFFEELQKPICLIAHNGLRFDFKLLLNECNDANIALPSDLLCLDSLSVFQKVLPNFLTNNDESSLLTDDEDEIIQLNKASDNCDVIDDLYSKFEKLNCNNTRKQSKSNNTLPTKVSYKLDSIYQRLLGEDPPAAHRAEQDCYTLMQCVLAIKDIFISYADNNNKELREIKPFKRY